jgi:L-seryl-tRNA(Ser) seleniumtransferase
VIQQSGARLVDVGTTNKTYAHDYEEAIRQSDVSLIMSIHSSNFEITGFVHRPSTRELVGLGRPLVVDIGSGLLDRTCPWLTSRNHSAPEWLCGEPAARQSLEDGAALVIFSGDKLLGGPQCGIIAGDSELVARCASHPLMRALRPGAETLQSLQSVLLAYAARDAVTEIPFWSMVAAPLATLKERANAVASAAGRGTVQEVSSLVGAGSAPSAKLRSFALVLEGDHAVELRRNSPPVIARVDQNKTYCDLRSVAPDDDTVIVAALRALTS